MRKLALVLIVLMSALVYGAAPTVVERSSLTGDITIDSQHTGGWECVDSLYLSIDDTSGNVLTITGVALLKAGSKLYIGFGNDSANRVDSATGATTGFTNSNLDTVLIEAPKSWRGGQARVAFSVRHVYVYTSQTDVQDTFYFNAACGGSDSWDYVKLEDVVVTAAVGDYNAAFD